MPAWTEKSERERQEKIAAWEPWQRAVSDLIRDVMEVTKLTYIELGQQISIDHGSLQRQFLGRAQPNIISARALFLFCTNAAEPVNVDIPPELRDYLLSAELRKAADEEQELGFDIKQAVGITSDLTTRSIANYSGNYWMCYWAEDGKLALLRACLHQTPRNGVPVYRAWRNDVLGFKVQVGSYFVEGEHLSLIGTRKTDIDVRLATFHCNPGEDRDSILNGSMQYTDRRNEIVWTRVVLFRNSALHEDSLFRQASPDLHDPHVVQFWFGPAAQFVLDQPPIRLSP